MQYHRRYWSHLARGSKPATPAHASTPCRRPSLAIDRCAKRASLAWPDGLCARCSEVYRYYSLPFCRQHTAVGLWWTYADEPSSGVRATDYDTAITVTSPDVVNRAHLPLELKFTQDQVLRTACNVTLSPADVAAFRDAVNKGLTAQVRLALLITML